MGAFLIQGLVPGPEMLTTNLEITYSMVWSVALANILGAGVCFLFSNQFARVSQIRHAVILPLILAVLFIGAFQGRRDWGDLLVLIVFGIVGWVMKRRGWPRPPVILGVVLGGIIERYMWISTKGSLARTGDGSDWISNGLVVTLLILAVIVLATPLIRDFRGDGGIKTLFGRFEKPRFDGNSGTYLFIIALFAFAVSEVEGWRYEARFAPQIVGWTTLVLAIISFLNHTFRRPTNGGQTSGIRERMLAQAKMDISTDESGSADTALVRRRTLVFAGWIVAFLVLTFLIGMLPTIFLFTCAFMIVEGERWRLAATVSACLAVFCWFVFDDLLALPWPDSLLGRLAPGLKDIVPGI